jgi:hypothetical protein
MICDKYRGKNTGSQCVKALEWASVSIGAPLLGNMERHSFLMAYEIKSYIKRYVKMLCKWVSLSKRAPLGILEGIRLPRHLDSKRKYIYIPFLDPEDINILSLGPSGTLVKGQTMNQM